MLIIEDPFQKGFPAVLIMLGAVVILAFLRLVVPRLIERFQHKQVINDQNIKKKSTE